MISATNDVKYNTREKLTYGTKYSRMDQVKFEEDSL